MPLRLGAVSYLNARPLTWALDRTAGRWQVRYDLPSVCADLLSAGDVDLGLVPSIEYLRGGDYRIVPGVGICSDGPVASVALYTRGPVDRVRRLTLDTSSRTSVALIRILCRERFHIEPTFVPHGPDLSGVVRDDDAALIIGDPAFELDHEAAGLQKVDLGAEWSALTGLPFVYAAWTGRAGAASTDDVGSLRLARDEGLRARDAIAEEYGGNDRARVARAAAYLRDNVKYEFGAREAAGLQTFLDFAADLGLGPRRTLEFY